MSGLLWEGRDAAGVRDQTPRLQAIRRGWGPLPWPTPASPAESSARLLPFLTTASRASPSLLFRSLESSVPPCGCGSLPASSAPHTFPTREALAARGAPRAAAWEGALHPCPCTTTPRSPPAAGIPAALDKQAVIVKLCSATWPLIPRPCQLHLLPACKVWFGF